MKLMEWRAFKRNRIQRGRLAPSTLMISHSIMNLRKFDNHYDVAKIANFSHITDIGL